MKKEIKVVNSSEKPICLQIEPWADLLYLLPDESICIKANSKPIDNIEYDLEPVDHEGNQVLHIDGVDEYFIVEGGLEIHHSEYGSNVNGWSKPLHKDSSLKKKNISI